MSETKKEFRIDIDKSAWEDDVDSIPESPGFYFVYPCRKKNGGPWVRGRLLYIGQTENLKQRLYSAPEVQLLAACINGDYSKLLYTYGMFDGTVQDRLLCEKLLVSEFKPAGNRTWINCQEEGSGTIIRLSGLVDDWDLKSEITR